MEKKIAIIFSIIIIVCLSMGCINELSGVKCPNCNSTDVEVFNIDSPADKEFLCQCSNCGAYFYEGGSIFGYNETINKKYKEKQNKS